MTEKTIDRPCEDQPDDEINLLDYWRVLWKHWKMIGGIVALTVVATVVISLFMTNIYQARAVIIPVAAKDSGTGGGAGLAALAQQFGGLPGISMPGSASAAEIVSLLKSNILRGKMIQQYNLMPVLFYQRWDAGKQTWGERDSNFSLNPLYYVSLLNKAVTQSPPESARGKDPNSPDLWDALRLLDDIVRINQDTKQNTITISADFHDPEMAAKIVEYFLVTLTNYMSSEAKRVAATNRKYLEEQLGSTTDPFIKQKTYNMIAQQIETGMMAEVKENFAFKVIDPPLAPDKKIKPRRTQMAMLSLIVALFIGIFAAFLRENREKNRERT
jgi:uncharacterized protein involved in exopolysaccharide biosynthesis